MNSKHKTILPTSNNVQLRLLPKGKSCQDCAVAEIFDCMDKVEINSSICKFIPIKFKDMG